MSVLAATESYVTKKIDPALLTWEEFYSSINKKDKCHPSSAYNWSLDKFKDTKEEYPVLLYRKNFRERSFEFRMNKEDRYEGKFVKTDPEGRVVSINGETQYYTRSEEHTSELQSL